MRRVVAFGGHGVFGAQIVARLREAGMEVATPTLDEVDVEDAGQVSAYVRERDIVLDAAGPFQARTTTMLEAAIAVGADVVDIDENLGFARRVRELRSRIETAGITVCSSCSAVSVATSALVAESGLDRPDAVAICLVPASAETPSAGTARSLLDAIGNRVAVLQDGQLVPDMGWSEARTFWFPGPQGRVRGRLAESADALILPETWPSLLDVDFWIDTNVPGLNTALRLVAMPGARSIARGVVSYGTSFVRRFGRQEAGIVVAVAAGDELRALALAAPARAWLVGVLPSVLTIDAIQRGRLPKGLVAPAGQVERRAFFEALAAEGVGLTVMPASALR